MGRIRQHKINHGEFLKEYEQTLGLCLRCNDHSQLHLTCDRSIYVNGVTLYDKFADNDIIQ